MYQSDLGLADAIDALMAADNNTTMSTSGRPSQHQGLGGGGVGSIGGFGTDLAMGLGDLREGASELLAALLLDGGNGGQRLAGGGALNAAAAPPIDGAITDYSSLLQGADATNQADEEAEDAAMMRAMGLKRFGGGRCGSSASSASGGKTLAQPSSLFPNLSADELAALGAGSCLAVGCGGAPTDASLSGEALVAMAQQLMRGRAGDDDDDDDFGLHGSAATTTQHAFKPVVGKSKATTNADYDDIDTDCEGEDDEAEDGDGVEILSAEVKAGQPATGASKSTSSMTITRAQHATIALANSHVDPNTAILLAGLAGGASSATPKKGSVSASAYGSTDADADTLAPPKPLLNGFVVSGEAGSSSMNGSDAGDADSDGDVDALANLLTSAGTSAPAPAGRRGQQYVTTAGRPIADDSDDGAAESALMAMLGGGAKGPTPKGTAPTVTATSSLAKPSVAATNELPIGGLSLNDEESSSDGNDDADEDDVYFSALPDATTFVVDADMDPIALTATTAAATAASGALLSATPRRSGSISTAAANGGGGGGVTPKLQPFTAAALGSDLKDLVDEVDDCVMPMTLDPDFDYDKHINGFTSRFGELIRAEENGSMGGSGGGGGGGGGGHRPLDDGCNDGCAPFIPDSIVKVAKELEAFHRGGGGGGGGGGSVSIPTGATAASGGPSYDVNLGTGASKLSSKFASLFLNDEDPFAAPTTAIDSANAAMMIGKTAFATNVTLNKNTTNGRPAKGLGTNRLVEECDDGDQTDGVREVALLPTREDTAHKSLMGVVDEGNTDDQRVVDIIMRWATAQQ